jgi:diadenosine tetraphosphate (Ap4A) HIT family hydrolase
MFNVERKEENPPGVLPELLNSYSFCNSNTRMKRVREPIRFVQSAPQMVQSGYVRLTTDWRQDILLPFNTRELENCVPASNFLTTVDRAAHSPRKIREVAPVRKLFSRREYNDWLRTLPKEYCAFCDWKSHQILLHEGRYWLWIMNLAPYWRYHTLLIPKRHVREFSELDVPEVGELVEVYSHAVSRFRRARLSRSDDSIVEKFVFFWRLRDNPMDFASGNQRPDHFHIHFVPDRDQLFDPVLDDDAVSVDIDSFVHLMSEF